MPSSNTLTRHHPKAYASQQTPEPMSQYHERIAHERIAKIFNTALITTRTNTDGDLASELNRLMRTPEFQFILSAIQMYSESENLPEQEAAERLVETFRRVDRIWRDYVFQEGVRSLKGPTQNSQPQQNSHSASHRASQSEAPARTGHPGQSQERPRTESHSGSGHSLYRPRPDRPTPVRPRFHRHRQYGYDRY